MNYAIIFAGGVGSRLGSNIPKQFLEIENVPILIRTIQHFDNCALIDQIIVISKKEYVEKTQQLIESFNIKKIIAVLIGGITAFESQQNGVDFVSKHSMSKEDIVLVHDGVRPFISEELIKSCISAVKEKGTAITVSPAFETIAIKNKKGSINETIPRQDCLIARAPQAFYVKDLVNAHCRAKKENKTYIDSASMMLDQNIALNPIMGPDENIKITTQYDYLVAKLLVKEK